MKYQIISAFIDRRNGQQINPGDDLPEGLDRETIERLIGAQCLRPIDPEPQSGQPEPPAPPSGADAGQALDLFGGEAGDSQAGDPGAPDGTAGTDAAPQAGASAPSGSSAPSTRRGRRAAVDVAA